MNRVYIVDDEANIVNLITCLISWSELNLQLVGTSTNSVCALQEIIDRRVDILIADINMPEMDGLELLGKAREVLPELKAIVVSGYQSFSYAYQAIKYGVKDYLLKPISKDELNRALARLINVPGTAETIKTSSYVQELEARLSNSAKRLRKQFLHTLYRDNFVLLGCTLDAVNTASEFHFAAGKFIVCFLQLDKKEYALNLSSSIFGRIERRCREIMDSQVQDWECMALDTEMLFLFNFAEEKRQSFEKSLKFLWGHIQNIVASYQVLEATFSVGLDVDTLADVAYSFRSVIKVNDARASLGRNYMRFANVLADEGKTYLEKPFFDEWTTAFNEDGGYLMKLLKQDLERIAVFLRANPTQSYSLHCSYVEQLLDTAYERFNIPENIDLYKKNALHAINMQESLESISSVICQYCEEIFTLFDGFKFGETKLILTAKNYINANSAGRIGLDEVAQYVHLSPTYFGVLFKKETGENFTDYLTGVRIEKAKELLKGIEYNVSEISNMVGYGNVKHFSKKFKAIVGVTPNEFRRINQFFR